MSYKLSDAETTNHHTDQALSFNHSKDELTLHHTDMGLSVATATNHYTDQALSFNHTKDELTFHYTELRLNDATATNHYTELRLSDATATNHYTELGLSDPAATNHHTDQALSFDAVVCCHPKDELTLHHCVNGLRTNVNGLNKIYIISDQDFEIPDTIWVPEQAFPFTIKQVQLKAGSKRAGWYLQQLLKIYSMTVIPGCSKTVLVVDADTVFLRPVSFTDQEGRYLYTIGEEAHEPYFVHMAKLHPSLTRTQPVSGICHHMIMKSEVWAEIVALVEGLHHRPFWAVFMDKVVHGEESGASEYEIYFHYIFRHHTDSVAFRRLTWKNSGRPDQIGVDHENFDYVAYHAWMR